MYKLIYEAEKASKTDLKEVRFDTGHFISVYWVMVI